jgi:hypothetical protein
VQRSFGSESAASTKNVEIISKSDPEVQRSFVSGSAAFVRFQKCSVRSIPEEKKKNFITDSGGEKRGRCPLSIRIVMPLA